jgi:hypothetical protein
VADTDKDVKPIIEPIERTGQFISPSIKTDKLNEVIAAVNDIARAVETMAYWLVQAQTGFNAKDAENVVRIVRGESQP